jgi:hypothetical protein
MQKACVSKFKLSPLSSSIATSKYLDDFRTLNLFPIEFQSLADVVCNKLIATNNQNQVPRKWQHTEDPI